MNISGIRPFAGFYNYNTIKTAAENGESVEQAAKAQEAPAKVEEKTAVTEAPAKKQSFGSYDYAQMYRPEATPELKGAESDIKSLDMEKAISDMQKDQILQQYQFFVGTGEHAPAVSENFDL